MRTHKGRTNSSTSPTAIERRLRDVECVRRRASGLGFQQIAEQLGYYDASHARRRFLSAMAAIPADTIEQARQLENERYDAMLAAIWPKVLRGDNWSIDRACRISELRQKLLGLPRAVPQEVTVINESAIDAEIRRLTEEINAKATAAGIDPDDLNEILGEPEEVDEHEQP